MIGIKCNIKKEKKVKKIFSILLVFTLVITGTIGATGMSVSAAGYISESNSSYAHNLVLQLNQSPDPIEFWNGLSNKDQKIVADSLVSKLECKIEIVESSLRDDEFKEITVIVNWDYYDVKVWEHQQTIGWTYDYNYVTSWYRVPRGYGWNYGFIQWTYIGEIDYAEDYYSTYLYCESKGYWEVTVLGQVINTFDNVIGTTVDKDGLSY
ncbi:MAG: hypothetical protein WC142_09525 [Bacteroidales bacterium]|jgi:hypothetical protein